MRPLVQLERLTDAYLHAILSRAEYQRRRQDLERKLQALATQAQQLAAQVDRRAETAGLATSIAEFCQRIQAGLATATFEQKRTLVELLIDRVLVANGEVEIRYVLPTHPRSEKIRFCHLCKDYFQMIIQVAVGAMAYPFPKRGFDGTRIGVVSITGDPRRDMTGNGARGTKEGLGCCLVPLLTEQDIHQVPIPINGAVEVDQAPFYFDARLVDVPTAGATPIRVKSCHVTNGDIFVNKREKNYPFNSATCTILLLRKNFSSGASHLDNQFQKQWAKLLFFSMVLKRCGRKLRCWASHPLMAYRTELLHYYHKAIRGNGFALSDRNFTNGRRTPNSTPLQRQALRATVGYL